MLQFILTVIPRVSNTVFVSKNKLVIFQKKEGGLCSTHRPRLLFFYKKIKKNLKVFSNSGFEQLNSPTLKSTPHIHAHQYHRRTSIIGVIEKHNKDTILTIYRNDERTVPASDGRRGGWVMNGVFFITFRINLTTGTTSSNDWWDDDDDDDERRKIVGIEGL